MNQITRIIYMEQILDDALAALKVPGLRTPELESRDTQLFEYYFGPLWRADFEDDCAGKLPSDLKRGILSEDAIYNLLIDWEELQE